MKVLVVSHNYPPAHQAGTELYAAQLGAELVRSGHAVEVFCAEKDVGQRDLTLRSREHDGVRVHEVVNNLFFERIEETWEHPAVDALFARVLDEVRPDVLHVHHLLYLSIGCVLAARERGIPVVYTLHDFWLHCPRFGQRRHADGSVCARIDFERCGTCLASFKWRQSNLERRAGRALARLRGATGIDLVGAARGAVKALAKGGAADAGWTPPDPEAARAMQRAVEARDRAMKERLLPAVDRFLAPSRFLLEKYVEWGIPADRIRHVATGVDPARVAATRTRPAGSGERLRIGYLGGLAPHKGPHVLLEAWAALDSGARAKATLTLHGPKRHHDDYRARLAARAVEVGATIGPELMRDEVGPALSGFDLVVVPSLWYENAPLVILEALATRTPLAVTGEGGSAELVRPGVSGWHFALGDAADLARVLREVLADPGRLAALYLDGEAPRSFADTAREIEGIYAELLGERG